MVRNLLNKLILILILPCFIISVTDLNAQITRKVLFLGNSYTSVNNLPQLVHDVALSAGDSLDFDSNSPGGYQLTDHTIDVASQAKIMSGGWDYVVIQGQSQEPVTLYSQFTNGGMALFSQIRQYNPCAIIMPYMTWGRKNGDAANCPSFPLMCTYQSMDSTIRSRYLKLTQVMNGEVSPVSLVWNYIRKNHPTIDLYQSDGSHPSLEGSYAAACCFYTSIFKKDPTLITFNAGLNATDASIIKNAVKTQVFNNLQAWNFKKLPVSKFTFKIGPGINEVLLSALNQGVQQTYFWDFGDGSTSTSSYGTHSYSNNGTYTISLTTTNCDLQGVYTSMKDTVIQFCSHTPTVYTKNSWLCNYDTLWTQPADAYQWLRNGIMLPETNRYLPDYLKYNISGFSVISTLNGCSESSQILAKTPEISGYYFDAMGDPCAGDTVEFAVLHPNGLSGTEKILWYKNGLLLSTPGNEDTLLIFSSGEYNCKVINPASNCTLDTTVSSILKFECDDVGIEDEKSVHGSSWTLYPNPASENITIKFSKPIKKEWLEIYNAVGSLVRYASISKKNMTVNISDLEDGLYYVRVKDDHYVAYRFIKQ
jgi:PKD repeat protein